MELDELDLDEPPPLVRDPQKVVTVAQLHQLRDCLLEIERRLAEMSTSPQLIENPSHAEL